MLPKESSIICPPERSFFIHEKISPDRVSLPVYPTCGHEKIHQRTGRNCSGKLSVGSLRRGALFVFCNRNRDKIKVLQWDQDGFVLYYKRREKGRFPWPTEKEADGRVRISRKDLYRLLDGLVMEQFVQRRNYAAY